MWNALQSRDFIAVSVAQAIVEMAHKKIKSANADMILNRKKQRTVEKKKQSITDMWREGPVAKRKKSGD